LLTQKDYARRIGKSAQYVNKLVGTGKIVLRDGRVDPKQADAALKAWARPGAKPNSAKSAKKRQARAKKAGKASAKKRAARPHSSEPASVETPRARVSASNSLTAWRAKNEEVKAKLGELELKKAEGELLPKSEVLEAERWKNANIRTRFRRLARTLAPRMARIASASEAEAVLLEEIDLQLAELAADPLGIVAAAQAEAATIPALLAPNVEGSIATQ
jgi:hypothetical protein